MQNHCKKQGVGRYLHSTIGRKQIVALTGVGLAVFVLTHMIGNLLIFVGPHAYNQYSHSLVSSPLIYGAEAGLVALFFGHLALAIGLQIRNRVARPTPYQVSADGSKKTSFVQKSLLAQGLLIFVFVISHLITFKYGTLYYVNYGAGDIRDIYKLVIEVFQIPAYVGWYCVALVALGLHLYHGMASGAQTWGAHHPRYQGFIKCLSTGYALLVMLGFMAQPLYVYFFYRG